jgi:hypothetical protein
MRANHIIGDFEGAETFFDPQIVLSAAKGNFGVKTAGGLTWTLTLYVFPLGLSPSQDENAGGLEF